MDCLAYIKSQVECIGLHKPGMVVQAHGHSKPVTLAHRRERQGHQTFKAISSRVRILGRLRKGVA